MSNSQPPLAQVGKLINLIPVGLKEAALDSPTFRATSLHFGDQVDLVEKWLDDFMRSAIRVVGEAGALETVLSSFMSHAMVPMNASEAIIDHDYTLLAMKKYGDGARDYWASTLGVLKKLNTSVIDPIKSFMSNDLKAFKDARRTFENNQRYYDNVQNRYLSQSKTKEPSALREDAFQLHEARKAYLKASMDLCVFAPQLRTALDKMMVQVFFDQWREMKTSRENSVTALSRSAQEMDRVRGWTREMESSEKAFKRELQSARRQLEETAEVATRPSRELDDYQVSVTSYLGAAALSLKSPEGGLDKYEKQGWLNLKTYTGKPSRTVWVRRWAFVKNGIFSWLVQGSRSGGVEETERIGVLLCNVRPAGQEERRFCFEIKTKKHAMMVQAETQTELSEWLSVFDAAKQRALDDPASTDALLPGKTEISTDPAFSISPPPVPEFAATFNESLSPGANEESHNIERSSTLPVPGNDVSRESIDVVPTSRRSTMLDREDGTRDHASRIISKLDLHRKGVNGPSATPSSATPAPGGIASLIAASHGVMPISPGVPTRGPDLDPPKPKTNFTLALRDMPPNSLAPSTLANPPAPTNLSKAAVIVSGERGIGVGTTGGMPGGMLANLWGSSNWGFVNRLERGEVKPQELRPSTSPSLAPSRPGSPSKGRVMSLMKEASHAPSSSTTDLPTDLPTGASAPGRVRHRQTISLDGDAARFQRAVIAPQEFPNYYPLQLKTQDAQFRLLFPNVKREEKLVLVFRATWNPNDQQEFPGRTYVTMNDIYFYSNHLGLVLTTSVTLASIEEVTAAPGRDCDFLFLHFRKAKDGQPTRLTIKTFLENLKLLQMRLNFLVRNSEADEPMRIEEVIKALIQLESEAPHRSPSMESWEDVSPNTPMDEYGRTRSSRAPTDLKAPVRVDHTLDSYGGRAGQGKEAAKFKLPAQPVEYVPAGNLNLAAEKIFEISPKALFHVLFGDKSAVWQLLHHERHAQDIRQGPWISLENGHYRREFEYVVDATDLLGRSQKVDVRDYQIVDVLNDHLCYVITDKRTAWHLPYKRNFRLVSKLVITHVAKSRSKLAIFNKVEWLHDPLFLKGVITSQAMNDLELAALDTVDLLTDQVRRLGPYARTRRAIQIFGTIGQSTSTMQFTASDSTNFMNVEMRQIPQQRTLATLLFQTLASFAQSAITTILLSTGGLMKWLWHTFSANRIILLILFLSVLTNTFYTSRDRMEWWHERKAVKYMQRMGIQPNNVMTKVVLTKDIEDLIAPDVSSADTFHLNATAADSVEDLCFNTFYEETANLGTDDVAISTHFTHPSRSSRSASALKIQQTRRRLGSYRHDLLVAMRVVNSIEKEVLVGEWEKWTREEVRRCETVRGLIARGKDKEGDEMRENFLQYCGSCERAEKRIGAGME